MPSNCIISIYLKVDKRTFRGRGGKIKSMKNRFANFLRLSTWRPFFTVIEHAQFYLYIQTFSCKQKKKNFRLLFICFSFHEVGPFLSELSSCEQNGGHFFLHEKDFSFTRLSKLLLEYRWPSGIGLFQVGQSQNHQTYLLALD